MRWAKITSGAHETSQKHKQVLISRKTQSERRMRTCKMEMCNSVLKTNGEQDVNNEAAEWNAEKLWTLEEETWKSKMGNVTHQRM